MKFILHKDLVVPTKVGHTIGFLKGVPTYVPPEAWKEVQAVGAIPEDELPEPPPSKSKEPKDPVAREAAIMAAFEEIALKNSRDDFSGNGMPNGGAIFEVAGFRIEPNERDMLWMKFLQQKPVNDAEKAAADAKAAAEAAEAAEKEAAALEAQAQLDAEEAAQEAATAKKSAKVK